jgi:hypothetical protein
LQQLADHNTTAINTSATPVSNSREINTSENVELKPIQNQHLQPSQAQDVNRVTSGAHLPRIDNDGGSGVNP